MHNLLIDFAAPPNPESGMDAAALPRADETRVAVIGLGYVGLPLAVGFGRKLPTLGFDINKARIAELQEHRDHTLETSPEELKATKHLRVSSDPADLRDCNVFIVTVPTPIDSAKRPDLSPLESASRTVGKAIRPGGVADRRRRAYFAAVAAQAAMPAASHAAPGGMPNPRSVSADELGHSRLRAAGA